jgi:hypothetical protein
VRGSEFVRRIQALGRERGVEVQWTAHRGKGSHGLDKRAYHKMLKQLRLSERDFG